MAYSTSKQKANKKHRNRNDKNISKSNSFDAINEAFGKTPKWRKKEIAAKKKTEKIRQKLINSVKMIGDDDFNEDVFASLFDEKGDGTQTQTQNTNNDIEMDESEKPKKKQKRKRLSKRRRKLLYESMQQSPSKKRKLNDAEQEEQFEDKDFEDQGIIIKTVHSKKAESNTNVSKVDKDSIINAKNKILSQIHRFELTQLMVHNVPIIYDEHKLNTYLTRRCSVECIDIHLFHNVTDTTKSGRAIITFLSANDCAIGYKYLCDTEIAPDYVLSVKPISNRYDKQINHNKKSFDAGQNKFVLRNTKCKVIKLSNLHWKTTENDIMEFLKCIHNVLKIHIHMTSNGYTNGEAKVEFMNHTFVNEAIKKLNGKQILERNVQIERGISREVFGVDGKEFKDKTLQIAVFNISGEIEENDLKEFIVSEIGNDCIPIHIHLIHHLELFTPGYAFCNFESYEITNKVVQNLNNKVLGNRALRVIWSKPSRVYKLRKELEGKTKVVSFTNLRYDVMVKDIREFVGTMFDYKIRNVEMFENAKGFRYGMAKLWFASCEHAQSVVDGLNGKMLKGKVVHMNYWEERDGKRGGAKRSKKGRNTTSNKSQINVNKKRRYKLKWNDKWFEEHVDNDTKGTNSRSKKTGLKVPQRLLDQLLQ